VVRGFRNRNYWRRWPERFGYGPELPHKKAIWVHAVSVGEVRAAALLVPQLMNRYPAHRIVITTMTPTGSAQVRALFQDRVDHCYVAYDLESSVNRFLDRIHPELAIIMETELWPNLFHACSRRRIPILVSNVRMSEKSMRGYLRFPALVAATMAQVNSLAIQSEADANRMRMLGARDDQIHVTGSIKFELDVPASLREAAEVLRRQWGNNRAVWIAASTREGEDEQVLHVFARLRETNPDLLLVLVPRHPERCPQVARLIRKFGYEFSLRSEQGAEVPATIDVLLGDTMGELLLMYAAADLAFVGGSLVPTGGHNLLEPAALGKATVVGPHTFNFLEITRLAVERGAALQVHSGDELAEALRQLLADVDRRQAIGEAGRRLVEENRGALKQNLALIAALLPR
jgi:3-deoxy-D-manno-octulosonic-acid transferase